MSRKIISERFPALLIQGATVVDPGLGIEQKLDVLIKDGQIEKISDKIEPQKDYKHVDAEGLILSPGWFDMHVHFREPGQEHKETIMTGCAAAVAGGFTGVCPMPNTEPTTDKREIVEAQIRQGNRTMVDVHPIAAASKGRAGEEPSEMAELKDAGAVAFSDDGCAIRTAELTRRIMEYAGMFNCPVIEHAEDPTMTVNAAMNEGQVSTRLGIPGMPSVAEDITVARDIVLADYVGEHIHIAHISSKLSIELVRWAKQRGIQVTCETTPHHFTLTHDAVINYDTNTKMSPPLRSEEDVDAVIKGLQDNTIEVIATDHAPHASEEKEVEYNMAPFGIVGLETAMGLIISRLVIPKKLSLVEAINKVTLAPRRILNLPQVEIKEGQQANMTLFSPTKEWTVDKGKLYSKSRNTPFHEWKLSGQVYGVFNKGQWWVNPDY